MMRLNELLGTEFPFIQGGMANIATGEFAAAVSNAGALHQNIRSRILWEIHRFMDLLL